MFKKNSIGQSAGKHRIGETSTTSRKTYTQVSGNGKLFTYFPLLCLRKINTLVGTVSKDEDIVYSYVKA